MDKTKFAAKQRARNPGITKAEIDKRWKQHSEYKQRTVSSKGKSLSITESSSVPRASRKLINAPIQDTSQERGFVAQIIDPFSAAQRSQIEKGPSVVTLPTATMSFARTFQVHTDALGNFIASCDSNLQLASGSNGPDIPGFLPGTGGPGYWVHGANFTAVPKYSDFTDLYSNCRIVGMGMRYTPINAPLNQQGQVVGVPFPDDVFIPFGGTGLTYEDFVQLQAATVGPATSPMVLTSRPMDSLAWNFHLPVVDRLGPLIGNNFSACGSDVALVLRLLNNATIIPDSLYYNILASISNMSWTQLVICGSGLQPNANVGSIDCVWLVEAVPMSRSFSTGQAELKNTMSNDISTASRHVLGSVPPVVSEKPSSGFHDQLLAAVDSVQTLSGNLGVPMLGTVAGGIKAVLGAFKKRR